MDGDPVTEEPSDEPQEPFSFTRVFDEVFPHYLAIGMSAREFWDGKPSLARAYRRAFELRRRQRNWEMWMQGAYIYDAMLRVAPVMRAALSKTKAEPGKYPEEPWPLTEKEAEERKERDRIAAYKRMKEKLFSEAKRDREQKQKDKEASEVGGDRQT